MRFDTSYLSSVGTIFVSEEKGKICRINYTEPENYVPMADLTPLLRDALIQLEEYFAGQRRVFALPLSFLGTPFQRKVWQALLAVPYGKKVSYQDVAVAIGNPLAVRAVGRAAHCNPINIVVPCHRVIGKNGKLTGYDGGLPLKEYLLTLEKDVMNA